MSAQEATPKNPYTPVAWEYREIIETQIGKQTSGKVIYFSDEGGLNDMEGRILEMKEFPGEGLFILLDSDRRIRIDRIITLFGKPGAAYDEYDAYANACMTCMGGS